MGMDLVYVGLVFGLFVVPRLLVRLRIPAAVTSLLLGAATIPWQPFAGDHTLPLLATFGIVSLFLSAGLEIDVSELARRWRPILLALGFFGMAMACASVVLAWTFELGAAAAVLVALALLTPSTGFILDSLPSFGMSEADRRAVKDLAIGTEILALLVLFCTTQSVSPLRFGLSTLALGGLIFAIPVAFRLFAAYIAPHAPRTEFAFLIMVAVLSAYLTRKLGVYYLVGAFVVGVIARRFRDKLPAMSSERILHAVEDFGLVFAPFYFFHAGSTLGSIDLGLDALVLSFVLLGVLVPVRVAGLACTDAWMRGKPFRETRRIGLANVPTLVFSLVVVQILAEQQRVPAILLGATVYYTVGNTLLTGLLLHRPGAVVAPAEDPGGTLEREAELDSSARPQA